MSHFAFPLSDLSLFSHENHPKKWSSWGNKRGQTRTRADQNSLKQFEICLGSRPVLHKLIA